MASLSWLIFPALLTCVAADIHWQNFWRCDDVPQSACEVRELRIEPCDKNGCSIWTGNTYTFAVDFIPNFSSPTLVSALYTKVLFFDMRLGSLNSAETCERTPCPIRAGQKQTIKLSRYIDGMLPLSYDIKLEFMNPYNKSQACCLWTTLRVKR